MSAYKTRSNTVRDACDAGQYPLLGVPLAMTAAEVMLA